MNDELNVNARDYLRHALATVAYRGGKVLRGAPPEFATFRIAETSRTPAEILAHICDLFDWAHTLVRGREAWRDSTPGLWDSDVQRFFAALDALDELLAAPGSLGCPWERLFQGPIADSLTHIGQLAMLRRVAGTAVRGENYFRAEIRPGNVGPVQAAPRREFE